MISWCLILPPVWQPRRSLNAKSAVMNCGGYFFGDYIGVGAISVDSLIPTASFSRRTLAA